MNNDERNQYVNGMCRVVGNTPIRGRLTTNSKITNGGTYNQLVNTGIESRGFTYKIQGFDRKGNAYRKTAKIPVTKE